MLKQIGVGLVAGVVATAVMDRAQTTLIPAVSTWIDSMRGQRPDDELHARANGTQPESAPEKIAHRLADRLDVTVSRKRLETLGNRIHWAYGVQWGVPYALLPFSSGSQTGLFYGTALWLGSDELLLWALGIANDPASYPISTHLKALVAHCVYGVTLGTVVQAMESIFGENGAD